MIAQILKTLYQNKADGHIINSVIKISGSFV